MRLLVGLTLLAYALAFDYTQHEGAEQHCHKEDEDGAYKADKFNSYDEIACFTFELAHTKCPPKFTCTVESLGKSFEGRDIYVLHVTSNSGKKAMWIDSLINTDEWLAGATTTNLMEMLLSGYGDGGDARRLLDSYDWYFVPVMNPDGYVWSWKIGYAWTKSRSVYKGSVCRGINLDRNFDYKWGVHGRGEECGATDPGPSVASEVETRAIQNYILRISKELLGLWSVHAYGSMVVHPYGDCSSPSWKADYDRNLKVTCDAFSNTYNTKWKCGNNCELTGTEKTGSKQDWAVDVAKIKYSYVIVVRGSEWIPDTSEILPSAEETWNGLVAFLDDVSQNG